MTPACGHLTFTAHGTPVAQGSLVKTPRGMRHAHAGLKSWRTEVGFAALRAMQDSNMSLAGKNVRFAVDLVFRFNNGRSLRYGANDLDRLCRACFDALSGVVFPDDSAVYKVSACKELAETPGVDVCISELDDLPPGRPVEHGPIKDHEIPF